MVCGSVTFCSPPGVTPVVYFCYSLRILSWLARRKDTWDGNWWDIERMRLPPSNPLSRISWRFSISAYSSSPFFSSAAWVNCCYFREFCLVVFIDKSIEKSVGVSCSFGVVNRLFWNELLVKRCFYSPGLLF